MRRTLVRVGGCLNVVFVLFHVWLGWLLRTFPSGVRPLLETFNSMGTLEIAFFAFVSLVYPAELLATRVGRSAIALIVLTYLGRVLAELVLFPRVGAAVVMACTAVAAVYIAAVLVPEPRAAAAPEAA